MNGLIENKTVDPSDVQPVSDGWYIELSLSDRDTIEGFFVEIEVAAKPVAVSPVVFLHSTEAIGYVAAEAGNTYFNGNTSAAATEVFATGVNMDFRNFVKNIFFVKPGATLYTGTVPTPLKNQFGIHIKDTNIKVINAKVTRRM